MALQQHVDVRPEQLLLARCSLASKELLIAGLWEECHVRSVEATRALIRKVLFVLNFFFLLLGKTKQDIPSLPFLVTSPCCWRGFLRQ